MKWNNTIVSPLIIKKKIMGIQTWFHINYYLSNYIGKITKNIHNNIILKLQTTMNIRNVWHVSACTIQHGSTHAYNVFYRNVPRT